MKHLVTLLFVIMILSGCNSKVETSKEASSRVTYFKDERTGICFAQVTSATYNAFTVTSITAVDCDKVKDYLK